MDIADWRRKIDEIDRRLVALLSERAQAAHEIGKLKRDAGMPIYEPDRERHVFENTQRANQGPLPNRDLDTGHEGDQRPEEQLDKRDDHARRAPG